MPEIAWFATDPYFDNSLESVSLSSEALVCQNGDAKILRRYRCSEGERGVVRT